jgi:hypothetical protein
VSPVFFVANILIGKMLAITKKIPGTGKNGTGA